MSKYIKTFNNHSEYQSFIQSNDFIKPNMSHCITENEVHYNPIETRVVATFNVASAGDVQIYCYAVNQNWAPEYWILGVNNFSAIEIDGTNVSVSSLDADEGLYNLSAGQHTIAYTLKDKTTIKEESFNGCTNMISVTIPLNVTYIDGSSFNSCSNLTTVTFANPEQVDICSCSFAECENLDTASLNTINSINSSAFECMA